MTLLILLGLCALGVFVLVMLAAMVIGYISEKRAGIGHVLLGAVIGAILVGALRVG